MRAPVCVLLVVSVCLVTGGCDQRSGRLSPIAHSEPVVPTLARIVSGADQTPVVGASVWLDGEMFRSDSNGAVTGFEYSGGLGADIDVEATGFLKRQTTIPADRLITLWPVANEAEAQAVREMVYRRGGSSDQVLNPPDPGPFYVTLSDTSPAVGEAWRTGAAAFEAAFGLRYELGYVFQYETNEVAVRFSEADFCVPIAAWGFCQHPGGYKSFAVLPEKALDPQTIQRVLASWFLGQNPLPGLMNRNAPADALTPLETQTIRMILQRRRPTRWPDNDR